MKFPERQNTKLSTAMTEKKSDSTSRQVETLAEKKPAAKKTDHHSKKTTKTETAAKKAPAKKAPAKKAAAKKAPAKKIEKVVVKEAVALAEVAAVEVEAPGVEATADSKLLHKRSTHNLLQIMQRISFQTLTGTITKKVST